MTRILIALSVIVISFCGVDAMAAEGLAKPWQLGFQDPASPVMHKLYNLHHWLLIGAAAITVFVMLLLAYVCIRFRRSRNPVASQNAHNTVIEVLWTVIPIFILAAIFIPSYRIHFDCIFNIGCSEDGTPSEADVTIKVIGYQWYWNYEYPDNAIQFDSYMKKDEELAEGEPRLLAVDNPVYVPVNKNIRLLMTGGDVIHSWAMPAFGVKKDTVPGRLNETWFRAEREGTYYGQCSELCGKLHGFMPIQVEVVSQEKYDEWVIAQGGTLPVAEPEAAAEPAADAEAPAATEAPAETESQTDAEPAAATQQ